MVTLVKVIEFHFQMVTLVNFGKLQQDLSWHRKSIKEMFIINTNSFFGQHIGFIYLFDEVKCFETIRLVFWNY